MLNGTAGGDLDRDAGGLDRGDREHARPHAELIGGLPARSPRRISNGRGCWDWITRMRLVLVCNRPGGHPPSSTKPGTGPRRPTRASTSSCRARRRWELVTAVPVNQASRLAAARVNRHRRCSPRPRMSRRTARGAGPVLVPAGRGQEAARQGVPTGRAGRTQTRRLGPLLNDLAPRFAPQRHWTPDGGRSRVRAKEPVREQWSRCFRPTGTVPHLPGDGTPVLAWDFA